MSSMPRNTRAPTVSVEGLTKRYGDVLAVDSIGFELTGSTVTALLGGNGAGKTTTASMLMGLLVPTAGSVRVLGCDMARDRYRVLHRMNFESHYADLPMRLTVRQNLEVYARLYGVSDPKRIAEVAAQLRIEELMSRPYGKLSAGQQTRARLAKALLNRPEVLILDEPTSSLDPDTADWVRSQLEDYRDARGATILLTSHNMAEVERLADRVIILRKGRIIADAPPDGLMKQWGRRTLEEVFLDIARAPEGPEESTGMAAPGVRQ